MVLTMTVFLRAFLLGGLVLHKAIWELLKQRDGGGEPTGPRPDEGLRKKVVKRAKIAVLAGLLVQTVGMNVLPITRGRSRSLTSCGLALYLIGLTTAIVGRAQLGQNWANIEDRQVLSDQKLVTEGIYGYIRHPIYIGDILLVTGLELALGSWLFLLGLPLLAVVTRQANAEEALLSRAFPGYDAYRRRTRQFIPLLF